MLRTILREYRMFSNYNVTVDLLSKSQRRFSCISNMKYNKMFILNPKKKEKRKIMSINFDVVIDSADYSVDMKAGLDTLQGVSDATRTIAEFVFNDRIVRRQSHTSNIRTNLKETFKGSYGHIYSLEVYESALKNKLNKIGKNTFAEIMMYYICESLYLESNTLSPKAEKIIEKLDKDSEELIKQLRTSCLKNIHEISTKFGYGVKISLRKSKKNRSTVAEFNENTAKSLQSTTVSQEHQITASITRFNIFTGNGRLLVKDTSETVAFGFEKKYTEVDIREKRMLSDNLNNNNGLESDEWDSLNLVVRSIKLQDGKIVKYVIIRV